MSRLCSAPSLITFLFENDGIYPHLIHQLCLNNDIAALSEIVSLLLQRKPFGNPSACLSLRNGTKFGETIAVQQLQINNGKVPLNGLYHCLFTCISSLLHARIHTAPVSPQIIVWWGILRSSVNWTAHRWTTAFSSHPFFNTKQQTYAIYNDIMSTNLPEIEHIDAFISTFLTIEPQTPLSLTIHFEPDSNTPESQYKWFTQHLEQNELIGRTIALLHSGGSSRGAPDGGNSEHTQPQHTHSESHVRDVHYISIDCVEITPILSNVHNNQSPEQCQDIEFDIWSLSSIPIDDPELVYNALGIDSYIIRDQHVLLLEQLFLFAIRNVSFPLISFLAQYCGWNRDNLSSNAQNSPICVSQSPTASHHSRSDVISHMQILFIHWCHHHHLWPTILCYFFALRSRLDTLHYHLNNTPIYDLETRPNIEHHILQYTTYCQYIYWNIIQLYAFLRFDFCPLNDLYIIAFLATSYHDSLILQMLQCDYHYVLIAMTKYTEQSLFQHIPQSVQSCWLALYPQLSLNESNISITQQTQFQTLAVSFFSQHGLFHALDAMSRQETAQIHYNQHQTTIEPNQAILADMLTSNTLHMAFLHHPHHSLHYFTWLCAQSSITHSIERFLCTKRSHLNENPLFLLFFATSSIIARPGTLLKMLEHFVQLCTQLLSHNVTLREILSKDNALLKQNILEMKSLQKTVTSTTNSKTMKKPSPSTISQSSHVSNPASSKPCIPISLPTTLCLLSPAAFVNGLAHLWKNKCLMRTSWRPIVSFILQHCVLSQHWNYFIAQPQCIQNTIRCIFIDDFHDYQILFSSYQPWYNATADLFKFIVTSLFPLKTPLWATSSSKHIASLSILDLLFPYIYSLHCSDLISYLAQFGVVISSRHVGILSLLSSQCLHLNDCMVLPTIIPSQFESIIASSMPYYSELVPHAQRISQASTQPSTVLSQSSNNWSFFQQLQHFEHQLWATSLPLNDVVANTSDPLSRLFVFPQTTNMPSSFSTSHQVHFDTLQQSIRHHLINTSLLHRGFPSLPSFEIWSGIVKELVSIISQHYPSSNFLSNPEIVHIFPQVLRHIAGKMSYDQHETMYAVLQDQPLTIPLDYGAEPSLLTYTCCDNISETIFETYFSSQMDQISTKMSSLHSTHLFEIDSTNPVSNNSTNTTSSTSASAQPQHVQENLLHDNDIFDCLEQWHYGLPIQSRSPFLDMFFVTVSCISNFQTTALGDTTFALAPFIGTSYLLYYIFRTMFPNTSTRFIFIHKALSASAQTTSVYHFFQRKCFFALLADDLRVDLAFSLSSPVLFIGLKMDLHAALHEHQQQRDNSDDTQHNSKPNSKNPLDDPRFGRFEHNSRSIYETIFSHTMYSLVLEMLAGFKLASRRHLATKPLSDKQQSNNRSPSSSESTTSSPSTSVSSLSSTVARPYPFTQTFVHYPNLFSTSLLSPDMISSFNTTAYGIPTRDCLNINISESPRPENVHIECSTSHAPLFEQHTFAASFTQQHDIPEKPLFPIGFHIDSPFSRLATTVDTAQQQILSNSNIQSYLIPNGQHSSVSMAIPSFSVCFPTRNLSSPCLGKANQLSTSNALSSYLMQWRQHPAEKHFMDRKWKVLEDTCLPHLAPALSLHFIHRHLLTSDETNTVCATLSQDENSSHKPPPEFIVTIVTQDLSSSSIPGTSISSSPHQLKRQVYQCPANSTSTTSATSDDLFYFAMTLLSCCSIGPLPNALLFNMLSSIETYFYTTKLDFLSWFSSQGGHLLSSSQSQHPPLLSPLLYNRHELSSLQYYSHLVQIAFNNKSPVSIYPVVSHHSSTLPQSSFPLDLLVHIICQYGIQLSIFSSQWQSLMVQYASILSHYLIHTIHSSPSTRFVVPVTQETIFHLFAGFNLHPSIIVSFLSSAGVAIDLTATHFEFTPVSLHFCSLLLAQDTFGRSVIHHYAQSSQLLLRFLFQSPPSHYRGPIFYPSLYGGGENQTQTKSLFSVITSQLPPAHVAFTPGIALSHEMSPNWQPANNSTSIPTVIDPPISVSVAQNQFILLSYREMIQFSRQQPARFWTSLYPVAPLDTIDGEDEIYADALKFWLIMIKQAFYTLSASKL